MKYKVTVIETVLHEVEVEADNEVSARLLAHNREDWKEVEGAGWVETGEVEVIDDSISWSELADLTHATQVEKFGWCSCEDSGTFVYLDCPKEVEA